MRKTLIIGASLAALAMPSTANAAPLRNFEVASATLRWADDVFDTDPADGMTVGNVESSCWKVKGRFNCELFVDILEDGLPTARLDVIMRKCVTPRKRIRANAMYPVGAVLKSRVKIDGRKGCVFQRVYIRDLFDD